MANNTFNAFGSNTVPTLRRAINNAFVSLVEQLNLEIHTASVGQSFPRRPRVGQEFYLTAGITGATAGWWKFVSAAVGWVQISDDSTTFVP